MEIFPRRSCSLRTLATVGCEVWVSFATCRSDAFGLSLEHLRDQFGLLLIGEMAAMKIGADKTHAIGSMLPEIL